ncbi:hypothetical protein GCM10010411_64470 [Actinomadura fulvescens]|uniref:Integrase catalytic domain-containing protein n=2 Tax=Actinomadura fulvescens TaxID=46160 RepID=A0ABN3Q8N5_9ACTN
MDLGLRGQKRRLEVEDAYWRLILSGMGTVEACREVGIGRKTGYRWRAERGGVPPARLAEDARSSRYLSLLERQRIATLKERGHGVREIARRLGRAPSTISRELQRNMLSHDKGIYDADLAHARARETGRRERTGKLLRDGWLRRTVQAKLELDWSPQQIAAWLRIAYPDRPDWHVCHETIYQAVYYARKSGLSRKLTSRLRTGRPLRRRRRRPDQRGIRFIAPASPIDARPPIVELRTRIGDWEGDLIVGRMGHSAIGTLVDRTSRYLRLVHLNGSRSSHDFAQAVTAVFASIPENARRSLTWDQGSEMARHDLIAHQLSDGVYFAQPASPWLRGTNENTNGLLRQYFPTSMAAAASWSG